ncbi:MAG: PIN domain-containing protein [Kiritimatiellae bacterium]|nr:PIN domain-containing protein [Kiritimatiellia bacterium]
MKVGLDTSVVLRLLTGEPETQARRALEEVQELMGNGAALLVSDLVVAEVYFALQYHYGVPKAESLRLIAKFLADSGVKALGVASTVFMVPNLASANPGFVDRLIHAEYMNSVKEIITFEKAGVRLTGVRVLHDF